MKKISVILLLSAFALLTISSCKKYEDGPALSLLTKKQRISRTWVISSVTYGGITVQSDEYKDYSYDFRKDGGATITEDGIVTEGSWAFADDKEDLVLTRGNISQKFEIKRLTNKELWLESEDDSSDTDYLFKLEEKQ